VVLAVLAEQAVVPVLLVAVVPASMVEAAV
jgi:hypothetical protein